MTPRQTQSIRVEHIHVGDRHRHAPADAVERLARSMGEIGLRTPVTVRVVDEMELDGEMIEGVPVLVTGATRVAAARKLEWSHIECFVDDYDELDAELWEIDENLCRAELSEAEEAQHLARRKELWTARESRDATESGKTSPTLTGRGNTGFAANTAAATGQSKRTINQKVERGEKIDPDVLKAVTGSKWDKGVVLDILKKLSHAEQKQALFRVKTGASHSFQDAYDFIKGEPPAPKPPRVIDVPEPKNEAERSSEWRRSFVALLNRVPSEADREWARETLDRPVMDERYA